MREFSSGDHGCPNLRLFGISRSSFRLSLTDPNPNPNLPTHLGEQYWLEDGCKTLANGWDKSFGTQEADGPCKEVEKRSGAPRFANADQVAPVL